MTVKFNRTTKTRDRLLKEVDGIEDRIAKKCYFQLWNLADFSKGGVYVLG